MKDIRIIFIDDETDLRDLVLDYAQGHGLNVVAYESAVKAIPVIEAQNIDLIFSDIHMPELSGIEMLKKLRARNIKTPCVFWSGYWKESDRRIAEGLGGVYFLSKPCHLDDFRHLFLQIVSRAHT